jgi:hypothetical protein
VLDLRELGTACDTPQRCHDDPLIAKPCRYWGLPSARRAEQDHDSGPSGHHSVVRMVRAYAEPQYDSLGRLRRVLGVAQLITKRDADFRM